MLLDNSCCDVLIYKIYRPSKHNHGSVIDCERFNLENKWQHSFVLSTVGQRHKKPFQTELQPGQENVCEWKYHQPLTNIVLL